MGKVRIMSRYEEEHMGYVWHLIVDDVTTQGFDSFWGWSCRWPCTQEKS